MKKEIILILTENCNLSCTYCFEHYKSNKVMTIEQAKQIINKEMRMSDDTDECQITMFGGEPILEFNLIKEVYAFVETNISNWGKKILIFINTNGTLINDEIKNWLRIHRKYVHCGLSLDGNREMHNRNRSNSFDAIDIEFYKECWPEQTVKMTVSKETLPSMAEGIIYIHNRGFTCGCTFAYGLEWDNALVHDLEKQLSILVDYYSENVSLELCQILNIDLTRLLEEHQRCFKRCGAGERIRAYDTEGNVYPCHAFSPVGLGERAKNFIDYKLPLEDIHDNKKCLDCDYYLICPTCYGVNYIYSGNVSKRSEWLCKFFQLCVKASAIIQFRRLHKKNIAELNNHDYGILKAIEFLCEKGKI